MKHHKESALILISLGAITLIGVCILSAYDMLVPKDAMACHVEFPTIETAGKAVAQPQPVIFGKSQEECQELQRTYPHGKVVIDN